MSEDTPRKDAFIEIVTAKASVEAAQRLPSPVHARCSGARGASPQVPGH
jgi:hypothetical protein